MGGPLGWLARAAAHARSRALESVLTRPLYRLYERRLARELAGARLPRHIGVIHDGHRRFARRSALGDYAAGYRAGMSKFLDFLAWCEELAIPSVTCWLLSRENLDRPRAELEVLYELLVELCDTLPGRVGQGTLAVRFIGSLDRLPPRVREAARRLEIELEHGERRLTIALAYGGRQEIVDAARDLVHELATAGVPGRDMAAHIDAVTLARHLYTADLPDPDLILRTSGESRLSGFLLWQAAYAEYHFVDVHWPEFRRVDFLRALRDYTRRERRFGR